MGRNAIDVTGVVFGKLTAVERVSNAPGGDAQWACKCECGGTIIARGNNLRSGATRRCRSCGSRRERHGASGVGTMPPTPEYRAWISMRDRCRNHNSRCFRDYGGRGISICPEWDRFVQFLADMGPRPSEQHSIDRIDNEKGYCKENCRWALPVEQMNNRGNTIWVEVDGKRLPLAQFARETGTSEKVIDGRLRLGWSLKDAASTPVRKYAPRKSKKATP